MKWRTTLVILAAGVAAFTLPADSTSAMQAKADEAFAFRVCKLLDTPFNGAVSSGDGDGCEWGLTQPDGTTVDGEKIRSVATGLLPKEELKANFDGRLKAYQEGAQSGAFKLEPLLACEGGWQVSSAIKPEHPSHMGFYKCNQRVVSIDAEGVKSVRQFEYLTRKMVGLVE